MFTFLGLTRILRHEFINDTIFAFSRKCRGHRVFIGYASEFVIYNLKLYPRLEIFRAVKKVISEYNLSI